MLEVSFYMAWIAVSRILTGKYPPRAINGLVKVLVDDFHTFKRRKTNFSFAISPDEETQSTINRHMRKRTAKVAFETTVFYHDLLKRENIDVNKLDEDEEFSKVPVTKAADFRGKEEKFVNQKLKNHLLFFTSTGTTAYPPSGIWVSKYEMDFLAAAGAFSYLAQGMILPDDIVQISICSRAALSNWLTIEACRRIGAACYLSGLVDPVESLLDLSKIRKIPGKKEKASVIISYPSYVESLVRTGKEQGYSAEDFGVERIILVGEILTKNAKKRMEDFFNCEVHETYNCSELIPIAGVVCPEGNLHFSGDGQIEVVDLETFEEVAPGEEGLLCVTPFYPIRQGTLLLRYTPGDIVKKIDGCDCGLGGQVTSNICGKYDPVLMKYGINRRSLMEALESAPEVFLPLRASLVDDEDKAVLHICVSAKNDNIVDAIYHELGKLGLKDVELVLHLPDEPFSHYPNRCEMLEYTYHHLRRKGLL